MEAITYLDNAGESLIQSNSPIASKNPAEDKQLIAEHRHPSAEEMAHQDAERESNIELPVYTTNEKSFEEDVIPVAEQDQSSIDRTSRVEDPSHVAKKQEADE